MGQPERGEGLSRHQRQVQVKVEFVVADVEAGTSRTRLPDDVGGVWGYADFLKAIRNSRHPEHDEMLEWAGGAFDPAAFDLRGVNGMQEWFESAMAPRATRR